MSEFLPLNWQGPFYHVKVFNPATWEWNILPASRGYLSEVVDCAKMETNLPHRPNVRIIKENGNEVVWDSLFDS